MDVQQNIVPIATWHSVHFSAQMVRAFLEGRKTQARFPVDPQPPLWASNPENAVGPWVAMVGRHPSGECEHPSCGHSQDGPEDQSMFTITCPYGGRNDGIWVRETWKPTYSDGPAGRQPYIDFEAGPAVKWPSYGFVPEGRSDEIYRMCSGKDRWRSPSGMPQWASRIKLEILKIRVERLHDIDMYGAVAEGIPKYGLIFSGPAWDPLREYRTYWESTHGEGSWEENPWVWVLELRPL